MAVTVDITADLNDEDETGFVWTFFDEARDPSVIVPGAIVVAGDTDAPAVVDDTGALLGLGSPTGLASLLGVVLGRRPDTRAAGHRRATQAGQAGGIHGR